mmetsp:Transcript_13210/g.51685  ORF Transcript_13210/g.51685 Transcript_13210/m.51685 type:complete len:225 (-) Transcript_13210:782-1456(-)
MYSMMSVCFKVIACPVRKQSAANAAAVRSLRSPLRMIALDVPLYAKISSPCAGQYPMLGREQFSWCCTSIAPSGKASTGVASSRLSTNLLITAWPTGRQAFANIFRAFGSVASSKPSSWRVNVNKSATASKVNSTHLYSPSSQKTKHGFPVLSVRHARRPLTGASPTFTLLKPYPFSGLAPRSSSPRFKRVPRTLVTASCRHKMNTRSPLIASTPLSNSFHSPA